MQHQSVYSLGTTNNCHEQTSSSSSLFLAILFLASSYTDCCFFVIGAGGRRAVNNAFYERVKASVGEAEAATQNEALPGTPDEILTQAQEFKQDITRHNRRSIHH